MKSYLAKFVFFLFISVLFAQTADTPLVKYKKSFVLGSITEKNAVISEAVKAGGDFSDLYVRTLRFSLDNKALLHDNKELTDLTLNALVGLQSCPPDNAYSALLWSVFSAFTDDLVKMAVINTISKGKYNSTETVSNLNAYVTAQATLEEAKREKSAFEAAVKTLGEIASPSSFFALFAVLSSEINNGLFTTAQNSLNNIQQDYALNVTHVIDGNYPTREKLIMFHTAMKNLHLSDQIRGEIAQKTLSMSINIHEGVETSNTVKELRQESLNEIYALHRIQAAPTVINYFILAQKEFKNGKLDVDPFVEIIECLGSMPTTDASKVLSGYLAALNSQAELNGIFNEKVVLAVITALGTLGDKSSFDTLLYVSYIKNYPDSVAEAARDALARLKW